PVSASTGNTIPQGCAVNCFQRFGWITKLSGEITKVRATRTRQNLPPNARVPSCNLPAVFRTTQRLPCIANATNEVAPTKRVYQAITPASAPGSRFVHNGRKKYPFASNGTPRTTLPSATPKTNARTALAALNTVSQAGTHSGLSMWFRNSIDI